jgi:hypothetical protein
VGEYRKVVIHAGFLFVVAGGVRHLDEEQRSMSTEGIPFDRWDIRGADSNSLLRMYDSAAGVLNSSPLQLERERAEKAMMQIAKELQKRKVAL